MGLGPHDNGQEQNRLPGPGKQADGQIRYGTVVITYGLLMEKYGPRSDLGQWTNYDRSRLTLDRPGFGKARLAQPRTRTVQPRTLARPEG